LQISGKLLIVTGGGKSNKNVKTVTKPLAKKVVQKYITIEVKVTVY
jgi:hypothetical protein